MIPQFLKTWWHTRVQKDLATFMGSLAIVDFTPYADDIHNFIPWPHHWPGSWHAALRIVAAIGVYWRAKQAGVPMPSA